MRPSTLQLALLLPAFTASLSTLDRPRAGFLQDVLEAKAAHQNSCKPTGLIQDACCDFETVENVNDNLFVGLKDLVATPFFRYHKEHIPEEWRSHKLGVLEGSDPGRNPEELANSGVDEGGFCVLEDEMDSRPSTPIPLALSSNSTNTNPPPRKTEGAYVDLLQNPERFTGYAGDSSSRVWKAIYEENCFTPVPYIHPSRSTEEGGAGFASLSSSMAKGLTPGAWGETEQRLMGSLAGPRDGGDEICLEKRVFYRLISGLHASISIHICDEYLDQKTGLWSPNLECFITRIAEHPERLQNVYFSYVVLLRALSKSGPQLLAILDKTSTTQNDGGARAKLEELLTVAQGCPSTFDETSMFSGPNSLTLKTEFKSHFRNVSRIMDCVGCDKCRLWGKLQVTGLGTALKLLFSADSSASPDASATPSFPLHTSQNHGSEVILSRGEAVAFVNTLHRFSESLAAVEKFRELWMQRTREEEGEKEKEQEKEVVVVVVEEPVDVEQEEVIPVISEPEVEVVLKAEEEPLVESVEEPTPDVPPEVIPTPPSNPNISVPEVPIDDSAPLSDKPPRLTEEGTMESVVGRIARVCKEGWCQVTGRKGWAVSDEL